MKLSIVIPVKNQSEKVHRNIKEIVIPFFDARPFTYDIIVCSDGSSQEERAKLEELFQDLPLQVKLLPQEDIKGKGHGVRKGVLASDGDYIITMDADLATDLSCIDAISPLFGLYDAFIPNRDHKQSQVKKRTFLRALGHVVSRDLTRMRFHLKNIHDTQCGFKVYRNKVAKLMMKHQLTDGFACDVENCYFLVLNGFSTYEFPVKWENDEADSSIDFWKVSKSFYKDLAYFKKNKKSYLLTPEEKQEAGL